MCHIEYKIIKIIQLHEATTWGLDAWFLHISADSCCRRSGDLSAAPWSLAGKQLGQPKSRKWKSYTWLYMIYDDYPWKIVLSISIAPKVTTRYVQSLWFDSLFNSYPKPPGAWGVITLRPPCNWGRKEEEWRWLPRSITHPLLCPGGHWRWKQLDFE